MTTPQEKLEAAREAVHKNRSADNVAAYKAAAAAFDAARTAELPPVAEGDAGVQLETVAAKSTAHTPG